MLWLDAHPDFNTPETTRSGSLGGMPVAVATGRALQVMRLDAKLDPPLSDRHVVMGGVRLTDPLEQHLLDNSMIEQLTVDDLRNMTPAVWAQLDRLDRISDKLYIHIDMDVLDPREVMAHGNKVPERPVERAAGGAVRRDLHALPEGVGDRLCDDSADRRGRAVDRGAEPDDRRRRARRESAAVGRPPPSARAEARALTVAVSDFDGVRSLTVRAPASAGASPAVNASERPRRTASTIAPVPRRLHGPASVDDRDCSLRPL